jgi:hypothetical protein
MLVVLSALGGLLESDPREIRLIGDRYEVPVLDLELKWWKKNPGEVPCIRTAVFEHRGRFRRVGDCTAMILEMVDYPKAEGSPGGS